MKRLVIDPQIRTAHCRYQDRVYEYLTQKKLRLNCTRFKRVSLFIKSGTGTSSISILVSFP